MKNNFKYMIPYLSTMVQMLNLLNVVRRYLIDTNDLGSNLLQRNIWVGVPPTCVVPLWVSDGEHSNLFYIVFRRWEMFV